MVLCRHLILTLVFRYLNLDIISILHTAGYSKHKTELLLPHGCQACSWHAVTPSGWEKPSWPLMPRPNLSAAWAQIHTVTLSMSPMSKKGLSGPGPRARIWGLPSPYAPNPHQCLSFPVAPPVPGALLWNPFLGETHEPDNTTPPFPQNDPKLLGAGTNPREGYSSTVPEATAPIHGYPGHNIQRQKPEGTPPTRPCFRGPGAPSRAVHPAGHTLGATHKLSLCIQTSVPTAWTHTTSRLGPLDQTAKDCACPLQGKCAQSIDHNPTG